MKYTALVLAAQRPGIVDPLAQKGGVSHKCLIDMDGTPMIERVLESLKGSDNIDQILISIDDTDALIVLESIKEDVESGVVKMVESGQNLYTSVTKALGDTAEFPVIICTADNALQTSEMIDHFCAEFTKTEADAGVSVTPAELIWSKYPEGQRRPYTLSDGKFSNCNLYGIRSRQCLVAAKPFEGGGQFGKSSKRILQAFGVFNLILYKYGRLSLDGVFTRISRRLGIKIRPVIMPFAEAPIDVDNERTERIALGVLQARRMNLEAAE